MRTRQFYSFLFFFIPLTWIMVLLCLGLKALEAPLEAQLVTILLVYVFTLLALLFYVFRVEPRSMGYIDRYQPDRSKQDV